jgi:uncharacterized protein
MFFDPLYFVFLAPGLLLAIWAQYKVKSAFAAASAIPASSGVAGAEAAAAVMAEGGVRNVGIEPIEGHLSDHYSPQEKVLRLSPDVYDGRSLAALGVAAHEAGHALQDAQHYPLMGVRNFIVPLANFGGSVSWLLMLGGFLLSATSLYAFAGLMIWLGIIAFSLTVLFQLVNLPVEFDASRRARLKLVATGLVTHEEEHEVGKVLNAAALTYVAATLTSVLTLLYFLFRAGLFSDRD